MATKEVSGELFEQLCTGDSQAEIAVFNVYYDRLVRLARRKLGNHPRRAFDEEDVALSAIHCFLKETGKGRFYRWQNGRELWRLLRTITNRKAFAHKQRELREKRGMGKVRGESVFGRPDSSPSKVVNIQKIADQGPSPSQLNIGMEQTEQLLSALNDESLRRVARLRLAGHTNEEIAESLGCVRRTVERKLERIRKKWQQQALKGKEGLEGETCDFACRS